MWPSLLPWCAYVSLMISLQATIQPILPRDTLIFTSTSHQYFVTHQVYVMIEGAKMRLKIKDPRVFYLILRVEEQRNQWIQRAQTQEKAFVTPKRWNQAKASAQRQGNEQQLGFTHLPPPVRAGCCIVFRGLYHMNTHDSLEWTTRCRRANNLGYEGKQLPCPPFQGLPKCLHRSYNKLVTKGGLFGYRRFLFGLLWEASLGSKSLAWQGEAACKTGKETGKEMVTKSRSTTVL